MFFPLRPTKPAPGSTGNSPKPIISAVVSRISVIITFLVGAMLLVDQQLESQFVAAPIDHIDKSSNRVTTAKGSFLAEFRSFGGPELEAGELLVMEVSPITNTVVAYKQYDALLVEPPRENVFTYWPVIAAMTLLSLFLIIRWNHIQSHFELMVVNLILLVITSIMYFVSH